MSELEQLLDELKTMLEPLVLLPKILEELEDLNLMLAETLSDDDVIESDDKPRFLS